MIRKIINLYEYRELSADAKNRIRDEWRTYDVMDAYNGDYESVLKEFSEICNVNVYEWEVGLYRSSFRFKCDGYPYEVCDKDGYVDEYIALESLSGKLLFRYVLNNIIPHIVKGKYHSTGHTDANGKYTYKSRRSRVVMECEPERGACPLTGYYADCDILEPIMKYYRTWASYPSDYTYEDLMNECLSAFFDVWEHDYEYQNSDEAVDESIECNWGDKLFFADGTEYGGELDGMDEELAA